jgi:hypothetical protein
MATAIQWLAAAALLAVLFWLFRFAMGLRFAKRERERERLELEARGRCVVAEVPSSTGGLGLFVEDAAGFEWQGAPLRKAELEGVRLLVNGRVVDARLRPGASLPPSGQPEREGRERWDVLASLCGGREIVIPCGSLGEGVSREAAQRVFAALARALPGGEA